MNYLLKRSLLLVILSALNYNPGHTILFLQQTGAALNGIDFLGEFLDYLVSHGL